MAVGNPEEGMLVLGAVERSNRVDEDLWYLASFMFHALHSLAGNTRLNMLKIKGLRDWAEVTKCCLK